MFLGPAIGCAIVSWLLIALTVWVILFHPLYLVLIVLALVAFGLHVRARGRLPR